MIFSMVFVIHIARWCYQIGLGMLGCRQLANYFFIIHLDGCMCSSCCGNNFMMIMTFYVKLVNNKVVDNLLIYHVLNFHNHRPYGLRIIVVWILLQKCLLSGQIWIIELFDLDNYWITLRLLKESCSKFHKISRMSTTILFWCV